MALKKLSFSFYFLGTRGSNSIFFIQRWFFSLFFEIFIALRANLCYPIVCEFASTGEAGKFRICGP